MPIPSKKSVFLSRLAEHFFYASEPEDLNLSRFYHLDALMQRMDGIKDHGLEGLDDLLNGLGYRDALQAHPSDPVLSNALEAVDAALVMARERLALKPPG